MNSNFALACSTNKQILIDVYELLGGAVAWSFDDREVGPTASTTTFSNSSAPDVKFPAGARVEVIPHQEIDIWDDGPQCYQYGTVEDCETTTMLLDSGRSLPRVPLEQLHREDCFECGIKTRRCTNKGCGE